MQSLELKKSWCWFTYNFDDSIPFFTFVDFNLHKNYVLDTIYKNNLTIIDCSQDPVPVLLAKTELLSVGLDDRVVFLTSNYADYSDYNNIFYFPYQLFRSKRHYDKLDITIKRKYNTSFLSRNPNTHKIYTFLKLYESVYFDRMMIGFSNYIPDGFTNPELTMNHHRIRIMPDNIKKRLAEIKLYRRDVEDDLWNWISVINENSHPAFSDTYLNIIAETSYEEICLSEKTFKPLISGQLFTFSSAARSLETVKKIGFEIFDDVLSSTYDYVDDMYLRIDSMISLIDENYDNLEYIYRSKYREILFNQEYFQSDQVEMQFIQPLIDIGVIEK